MTEVITYNQFQHKVQTLLQADKDLLALVIAAEVALRKAVNHYRCTHERLEILSPMSDHMGELVEFMKEHMADIEKAVQEETANIEAEFKENGVNLDDVTIEWPEGGLF